MNVRVRLVWKDAENQTDVIENQILLDVVIDPDTRLISGPYPYFGVYGPPVGDGA